MAETCVVGKNVYLCDSKKTNPFDDKSEFRRKVIRMTKVSNKKKCVVAFAIATAVSVGLIQVYDVVASEKNGNSSINPSMIAVSTMYDNDINCIWKEIYNVTQDKEKASILSRTIADVSFKEGVSPILVASIIEVESMYNEKAMSPEGRVGLMGLYPSMIDDKTLKLEEPKDNIIAGARIIKRHYKMFNFVADRETRTKCIIVGYCAGTGYANDYLNGKRKLPTSITAYVNHVMQAYNRMKGNAI